MIHSATADAPPRMLLSAADARKALGLSERTLRNLTVPHGPIPAVRVGRLVKYRPEALAAWADSAEQQPGEEEPAPVAA
ncbi:helix-turn-helix domain-containing protein [Alienimonas chondri]|uniref:Helix-turn-helix domain-containing protein n=1 Tax=Alienimonas chondri TaxID=2681879 RepID=A0ABX1VEK0_9PLAN|nr:helix-turn-helix domain-containing protein [Alienimonas chondri]NNJ26411.1 hypothetical protein [Alienimonas chondri]